MSEETRITFKNEGGFRISKSDLTTGKVIVNGIEITSVEDWEKVTQSIVELQQENKQLKDNWNKLKKWLRIKDILANSKINPQSIKFKDLLKHMEYLEKER